MTRTSSKRITGWRALLRDARFWQIAFQVIVVIGVVIAFSYLASNLQRNMARSGIDFGFSFLQNPAGFAIGETMLSYRAQDAYSKAIQAGIVNSLRVMIVGIVLATVVGVTAGVASFSDNWLLYKISRIYVGLVRNIPLLIQLFFWYLAVFFGLPRPTNQIVLPTQGLSWVTLSNRGVYLPSPAFTAETWTGAILLVLALLVGGLMLRSVNALRSGLPPDVRGWAARIGHVAVILLILVIEYFLLFSNSAEDQLFFKGAVLALFSSARGIWIVVLMLSAIPIVLLFKWRNYALVERGETGQKQTIGLVILGIVDLAILLFALGWRTPEVLEGGGVTGGLRLTLEYAALVTGLVFYTGAFIAEIVRAGIQSVSKGQWEAARALGLNSGKAMRLVVFPQALRVIIPPLNSEFMNLAKNSSLALAVGYPDLYSVATTTFNQTGRPIEVFVVMMGTFLVINLLISLNMNQLNNLVQFKER